MEFEEYLSVSIVSCLVAILSAASARWHFTEVPWIRFFRNPSFFGGLESRLRDTGSLVCWCALSVVFCLLIAFLAKQGEPLIDKFYAVIEYDHKADAGITTLIIVVLFFYGIVVSRTRRIVRQFGPALSGSAIDLFRNYWNANKETSLRPIKLLVDVYPLILAHFYKPFCDYYLTRISGCSSLLLQAYGPKTTIAFCDHYRHYNQGDGPPPIMIGIDPVKLDSIYSNFEQGSSKQARAILFEKVTVHGYYGLDKALNKYVVDRHTDFQPGSGRCNTRRKFFKSRGMFLRICPRVICEHLETSNRAKLIEYSEDGAGFYISLKETLSGIYANSEVLIKIPGKETTISAEIVHSEARYWNKRVISGHGVRVNDQNSRKALCEIGTK